MKLGKIVLLGFSLIFACNNLWALPDFKEVRAQVRRNPNDLKSRYLLGKYYLKMHEYKKALREWKYIVKKRPNLWKIYNRIGLIRYKMGARTKSISDKKYYWKKALLIWRHVHKSNPKDKWSLRAFYKVRTKLKLLQNHPKSKRPNRRIAKVESSQKDTEKETLDPNSLSSADLEEMQAQAFKAFNNEGYMEAAKKYAVLARSNNERVRKEALFFLGRCHLKEAEDPGKAIDYFKTYKEKYGEDARVMFNMGSAYGLSGNFRRQIDCYKKSLGFEPDSAETHFQLALAYDKVNESNKIVEHVQRAVQEDPSYKKRLQPLIKNSNLARKLGNLVNEVLRKTKDSQLSDEQIDEFARRVGEYLGEETINPEGGKGSYRKNLRSFMSNKDNRQNLKNIVTGDGSAEDIKKMAEDAGITKDDVDNFRRRRRR